MKTKALKNTKYSIGFDLGGTKLAAALVDEKGRIVEMIKAPVYMSRDRTPLKAQKRIVQMMADIASDFKRRYPVECSPKNFKGVGLVSAGPLNVQKGLLVNPENYPGWKIVPIRQLLEDKIRECGFKTRVRFQHDGMAAAFAEGWVGGARKMNSFCVVTVGTGIGTGVILNGQPCQSRGMGSEFGHTYFREGNEDLTVEKVAAGTGLLRRARELGFKGESVEELVAEDNPKYESLFDDMAKALAALCYNLSIGFNLEAVFFSGGLLKIQHKYFSSTQKYYQQMIRGFNAEFECPLVVAQTRTEAGVIGAGYLWFSEK